MDGDVWAVPYMPRDQWKAQTPEVWADVEQELRRGWGGKLRQARELCGAISYDPPAEGPFRYGVAEAADGLGAPVGQMFTACALRAREEYGCGS